MNPPNVNAPRVAVAVRLGPARLIVNAIARASGVRPSDAYRTLLAEALAARRAACGRRHRGPVTAGVCSHCGGGA